MAGIINFRAAVSDLLRRMDLAVRAGLTFNGARDLYGALGYKLELTPDDYRFRYRRGGIAGRIVDIYPKATWRDGAELIEDDDPKTETEFELAWTELNERLSFWTWLCRADTLAGLGQHSILLLGLPGRMEEPFETGNPEDLMYLATYGEEECTVDTIDQDSQSKRFGQPLTYRLRRKGRNKTQQSLDKVIHFTRVIHIADGVLDDIVYGTPRLERVWNDMDNLEKVTGGGSEAFWKRVDQGLFFEVDKDTVFDKTDDKKKMEESAEEFRHGMKRTMAMRGTKMTPLGSDVSPFSTQVTTLISLISGATGIPQRLLLGSERGELASSQDKENWDSRVSDRRKDFGNRIVREMVDRLIAYGILPEPQEYEVRWPDIEDLSQIERAAVAVQLSTLNKNAGGTVILAEEIRDKVLRMDKLEPSDDPANDPANQPPVVDPNAPPQPDPNAPPVAGNGRVAASSRPKEDGSESAA